MRKAIHILLTGVAIVMTMVGCSTQKNTGNTRWWHSFNARYNTFFNGSQAFIDGNLEKEKGNKDNYTELIPLYAVGNKASRDIGKGQYDLTIEKCSKAIKQHSIKVKPAWNGSKQKTAKDREWLGRREYNPFLWKVWLLMGKAQFQQGAFDEAAATFSYMSRLYQTQPLQNGLARAWLAKCYTELGWMYDAEDVIRNMNRDSMDFRAVKDWDYTYANYFIRHQEYQKALPYLHKVIKHERRRIQRAREWFLMGQIQQLLGNREHAYKAFEKVVGCHPPYELEFNARIAQTEVMAEGTNVHQMITRLKRMAASENNTDYLDQIYYAIGNIYLTQRDTTQAINAYEDGALLSVKNGIEKGVLLLSLGDLYWDKERFSDAQRCYGEAIGLLDKDHTGYEELSYRSKVLDELVPYTEAIQLQDSLLALADMPEAKRLEVIDRVIDNLRKKEEKERKEQAMAEVEQQRQQEDGLLPNTMLPTTPTSGNGQWYFYNPVAVSQGKTAFLRQWGARKNIDNWQRVNQTVVAVPSPSEYPEEAFSDSLEDTGLSDEIEESSLHASDPHQRDYYLAQIPFSEEQKKNSHDILKDALLHAGIIFKDKLDRSASSPHLSRHLHLSEDMLTRLTEDYQDDKRIAEAWYHLYLLYARQNRQQQADNCISRLQHDFPENEWTLLLSDPDYAINAKFGEHIEDSLYAATYEAFKNNQSEIVRANVQLSADRFPLGDNRAKFIFIDGLSRLNEGDRDGCASQLKLVVERYPDSEVTSLSGMILKGIQEGRTPYGNQFEMSDIWTRRSTDMAEDSTGTATLSDERNQHFLFILIYQPDSVNANQLLFEMARYNFTNFLVRNFEILQMPLAGDRDGAWQQMQISGFLNYDEALQYAQQLYADNTMSTRLSPCRSLIISEGNLSLIGTRYSYDDYMQFYEKTFLPMKISEEKLLILPETIEQPDIEETEPSPTPTRTDEGIQPDNNQRKQQVQDFDFGDDFW